MARPIRYHGEQIDLPDHETLTAAIPYLAALTGGRWGSSATELKATLRPGASDPPLPASELRRALAWTSSRDVAALLR